MSVLIKQLTNSFALMQFQAWYAKKVASQLGVKTFTPIDLKLSIVKPVGAKWLINLYDYFKSKPEIITNEWI